MLGITKRNIKLSKSTRLRGLYPSTDSKIIDSIDWAADGSAMCLYSVDTVQYTQLSSKWFRTFSTEIGKRFCLFFEFFKTTNSSAKLPSLPH